MDATGIFACFGGNYKQNLLIFGKYWENYTRTPYNCFSMWKTTKKMAEDLLKHATEENKIKKPTIR